MEEIILEDEKESQECDSDNNERGGTLHFLNVMTIEPMMFFQGLAWSITSIASSQMILYKTCRGKIFIDCLLYL